MEAGTGEWWWREITCIQTEKWMWEVSCKMEVKKKDLCISVLPSYCYVALGKSFPSLILVFLIWKIGRYEPSHLMWWRMSAEEVNVIEWKVHGPWTWPSWLLCGLGEALYSLSFCFKWGVSGLTEKGTFEKGLGGEGVSRRDMWGEE